MGEGYFHNEGYYDTQGGFSYRRLRMPYGGNYSASFTNSILRGPGSKATWATTSRSRVGGITTIRASRSRSRGSRSDPTKTLTNSCSPTMATAQRRRRQKCSGHLYSMINDASWCRSARAMAG
jgi:hypothetical protein